MSDQEERPRLENEEADENAEDVEGHKAASRADEGEGGDDVEGHKLTNKFSNKAQL